MLFPVGKVTISSAVLMSRITAQDLISAFSQYIHGHWGDSGPSRDIKNDLALTDGSQIIATYRSQEGVEFCICTHSGRTVIQLADELKVTSDMMLRNMID
jgi:hypothetical protein